MKLGENISEIACDLCLPWQRGGGSGHEQGGNGVGVNSKLLDLVEGSCPGISVKFRLQKAFTVSFTLLGLFSQFLSHVMHGLNKGGDVAIQSEHIVFKDFDMLFRRLAESHGNAYILPFGYKGNVFFGSRGCYAYELVVLKLLSSKGRVA